MRALRLETWHKEPVLQEMEEPSPGPGQVVIRVGGAGACHSDLHMMHGAEASGPFPLPFTLGHENAGWVHALGPGVEGLDVGRAVAVYGAWGCGTCARCRVGCENYCEGLPGSPGGVGSGLGLDGGMADYMVVPHSRYLVPLPDGLNPAVAAPLTDAGLTPYHAVKRSLAKLDPTSTAVVVGVGGLGHMAVQILKAVSPARVIAVEARADALELALSLGADDAVEAGEDAVAQVRRATNGRGADLVLDFVGSDDTLAVAAGCARALGDLTLIGVVGGSLRFGFLSQAYEVSLQTVYWGSRPELVEVLDLAARGLINPRITTFDLENALDAYRALAAGQLSGRAVIVPNRS